MGDAVLVVGLLIGWAAVGLLYWTPTIVGAARNANPGPVAVVNGLLGWTGVGWIVALAMAAGRRR